MPTYDAWIRTRQPADHGVFFINPFRGLVATRDRADTDRYHLVNDPKPYLYHLRITLNNPLIIKDLEAAYDDSSLSPDAESFLYGLGEANIPKKPGAKRRLMEMGYDGAVVTSEGGRHTEYFVLDSNQIEILDGPLAGLRAAWPRWR